MSLAAMVLADRSQRFSHFYDRWIELVTFGRAARVRAEILREIGSSQRMLDGGCGTGTLAVAAARSGCSVVAIDRSPEMLALAQEKAKAAGVVVDWRQGDLVFPPLDTERFDIATAMFVLSELSSEEACLAVRRMAEHLRPGGRLVIADEVTPSAPMPRSLSAIARSVLGVISFFVLQQLAPPRRHPWHSLLAEAGLEVVSERRDGSGDLVVLVAERPAVLPALRRTVRDIDEIMPSGPRRGVLRGAAWLALPIALRPGVYRIGDPGSAAPVLLTGNFLSSVEAVRSALAGQKAYLVIEDTRGWNVWCASDAGIFDAQKAAALMELYEMDSLVDLHRIIVPRLGARVRRDLTTLTGWEVAVGPIEARDLGEFLVTGPSPKMHSLRRLYRVPERIRVGALTLVQLPLFLLPLRLLAPASRRPAWRFALAASCLLPLAHDRLPGRTGVVKGAVLGSATVLLGLATGHIRPTASLLILAISPLVGWVYQSSSPVVFWKRLWR